MFAIVTKKIAEYPTNAMYSFKNTATNKSFTVMGDFPVLYPAMTVDISWDVTPKGNNLKQINVPKTPRNINSLTKHNINPDTYFSKIEVHNQTELSFKDLKYIDNPYVYSSDIQGLPGFEKADKIAFALGLLQLDSRRLTAIKAKLIELFRSKRQDTYTLEEYIEMYRKIENKGSFPLVDIDIIIESTKSFAYTSDLKLADTELLEAKEYVKKDISRRKYEYHGLLFRKEVQEYLSKNDVLKGNQRIAVEKLSDTKPTIVTGGAGVGKTTTVKSIIGLYSQSYNSEKICLLAPTGKASRRLSEATGMPATTIHNRLRKTPDDDYVYFDENRKLPYTLFIVDEASMIDTLLMSSLLKAIPEQAKLYLIGDCHQLYPVGPGEPFHDMIKNNECEVVVLTQNFRQDALSGISENARNILKGKKITEHDDFVIRHIKKDNIPLYVSEDILNISPYNSVNDMINKTITSKHIPCESKPVFYKGEKVIALKNTNDFCNGDTGIVEKTDNNEIIIRFPEGLVTVPKEDFSLIMPAYSLTVHKCQGSEYDEINIFLPEKMTKFITRRLVYTAVTRAKKKVNLFFYDAA